LASIAVANSITQPLPAANTITPILPVINSVTLPLPVANTTTLPIPIANSLSQPTTIQRIHASSSTGSDNQQFEKVRRWLDFGSENSFEPIRSVQTTTSITAHRQRQKKTHQPASMELRFGRALNSRSMVILQRGLNANVCGSIINAYYSSRLQVLVISYL
jgi:hypothetical protein